MRNGMTVDQMRGISVTAEGRKEKKISFLLKQNKAVTEQI